MRREAPRGYVVVDAPRSSTTMASRNVAAEVSSASNVAATPPG